VRRTLPDEELRRLMSQWRAQPESEDTVLALASAYLDRARSLREPRYFGRAEALLAPRALAAGAGADVRRLHAGTLQHRHAFAEATALLDALIRENPRDGHSRLQRASIRLTQGDFAGAREDCSQLVTVRGSLASTGYACLAQALAGSGELQRARVLLDSVPLHSPAFEPSARAYLLATRAELRERAGDLAGATADYREASQLAPHDDSIRAAWSDVLRAAGDDDEAREPLDVANPGLALLVRRVAVEQGGERAMLERRAREWLALEIARGDATHDREAALLALARDDAAGALIVARRNFDTQRELADVRVLARAIARTGDRDARRRLEDWLRSTNYQDAITRDILSGRTRG
jgi:tetratricopeptide (TPR) repeat protein